MASPAVAHVYSYAPYCGAPPTPSSLLWRWNLDPLLIAALIFVAAAYALQTHCVTRLNPISDLWDRICFYVGWAIFSAALISPLCALSVSLFSARVGQHLVIEMIAAPLIALGIPPGGKRPQHPLLAAGALAAILWFWHAPRPYTATFQSDGIYWLMHVTSFGAALWLWLAVLRASTEQLGAFLASMLVTTLQMGFLGALFTFSARPLFGVHALTTATWGLTPLQDQQLGGVIMWIPAGAIFLIAIMVGAATALRGAEQRARLRSLATAGT